MPAIEVLPHLIWTGALGLAVGNYATSFIYRMPLGQSPFTKHPYCGGCGTMLGVRDLMPGVSYPMLRGQCRHCGMSIPATYWWTEIFCAIIFMWGILTYGWSEPYLLVITGGTVLVTAWGQDVRAGRIFAAVLLLLGALGLSYRVLMDGTLYPAMFGAVWGGMVPILIWRAKQGKEPPTGEEKPMELPISAGLGAVAGVWLATFGLAVFATLWGVLALAYCALATRFASWPDKAIMPAYGLALMLLVLNPAWIEAIQQWLLSFTRP